MSSESTRQSAYLYGVLSLLCVAVAAVSWPGWYDGSMQRFEPPLPQLSEVPVEPAPAPVEEVVEPHFGEQVSGAAVMETPTEVRFVTSARVVRLHGIVAVDPNFLRTRARDYRSILQDGQLTCELREDVGEFHCTTSNGEDLATALVRRGLATFAGSSAPPSEQAGVPTEEPQSLQPPAPFVITNPVWLDRPSARDFARAYPERALEQNATGRVELDCLVDSRGRLGCRVATEEPAGLGFGAAALRIAREFRMAAQTEDGQATVDGQVRLPIGFQLAE